MDIINSQTIVYQQTISIDKNALKEVSTPDDSEYSEDEIQEQKEIDLVMDKFVDDISEKEKRKRYYYTIGNEKKIRYRRTLSKQRFVFREEWILIDIDNRVMNHFHIHNTKGAGMTAFPLDRTSIRDVEVTYKIREDKNDKKTILGYICHKIVVEETIIDAEFGIDVFEYEMYATDQIKLPFHLLNTTLKPVIESCPLELTTFSKNKGNSFSKLNAIKILEGKEADDVDLPERFISK